MTPHKVYNICLRENKRKPELESIIRTDPFYSYLYAFHVIKGRWPESEPIILTSPSYSYRYALDVMKRRWKESEPIIKQDNLLWYWYCSYFNIKPEKVNWKVGL